MILGIFIISMSISNPLFKIILKKRLNLSTFFLILFRIFLFILGIIFIFIGLYIESIY